MVKYLILLILLCGTVSAINFDGDWHPGTILYSDVIQDYSGTFFGKDLYYEGSSYSRDRTCHTEYKEQRRRVCEQVIVGYKDQRVKVCDDEETTCEGRRVCSYGMYEGRYQYYCRVLGCNTQRSCHYEVVSQSPVYGRECNTITEQVPYEKCTTRSSGSKVTCYDPNIGLRTNVLSLANFYYQIDGGGWERMSYTPVKVENADLRFRLLIPSICTDSFDLSKAVIFGEDCSQYLEYPINTTAYVECLREYS